MFASRGDYDADKLLTVEDIDLLFCRDDSTRTEGHGSNVTGDGFVTEADRDAWVYQLKNTFYGDANLDGEFNSADLISVFQAGEYEDEIEGNSTWATGNWNADGEFTTGDLTMAFQDGGYEQGPRQSVSAVPELSTALLCTIAAAFTVSVTRRKRF